MQTSITNLLDNHSSVKNVSCTELLTTKRWIIPPADWNRFSECQPFTDWSMSATPTNAQLTQLGTILSAGAQYPRQNVLMVMVVTVPSGASNTLDYSYHCQHAARYSVNSQLHAMAHNHMGTQLGLAGMVDRAHGDPSHGHDDVEMEGHLRGQPTPRMGRYE